MKKTLIIMLTTLLAGCAIAPSAQTQRDMALAQAQCLSTPDINSPACLVYAGLQIKAQAEMQQAQEANAAMVGLLAGALVGATEASYRPHRYHYWRH